MRKEIFARDVHGRSNEDAREYIKGYADEMIEGSPTSGDIMYANLIMPYQIAVGSAFLLFVFCAYVFFGSGIFFNFVVLVGFFVFAVNFSKLSWRQESGVLIVGRKPFLERIKLNSVERIEYDISSKFFVVKLVLNESKKVVFKDTRLSAIASLVKICGAGES